MKKATSTSVEFRISGDRFSLNRPRLQRAMREFNRRYRREGSEAGTKYAVFDRKGHPYPPKKVLSLAIGRPTNQFSGGRRTNRVFSGLGFEVRKAPRLISAPKATEAWPKNVPSIGKLLAELFSQRWRILDFDATKDPEAKNPGVYLIAYPKVIDLRGKRVREKDVLYIGMSNYAGVGKRLRQFWDGIHRGGCHSAGDRFHRTWLKGVAYGRSRRRGTLFVSWMCIPCETDKTKRSAEDLRRMGAIADLELCALARVKQVIDGEPELNRK